MRVAIFAHTNDEPELDTGVTTYNQELVRALCDRFPESTFTLYLAPRNSRRFAGIEAPNLRREVVRGDAAWAATPFIDPARRRSTVPRIAAFAARELLHSIGLPGQVSRRRLYEVFRGLGEHDVVIYSVFGFLPDFPLFASRILGVPCVSVLHDIRVLYGTEGRGSLRARLNRRLHAYLVGKILRASAASLVPSRFIKDFLEERYGRVASRIWISYTVPPVSMATPDPSAFSAAVASVLGSGRKFLFYPSTIVETKNHFGLMRALALLRTTVPDVRIVLAGSNMESPLGKALQEHIRQLELQDHVVHVGFVSDDEKFALFKAAVALIVPSIGESFSLPIWEAFACGCPVVASTDRDIPEQVGDAAIPCDPFSPSDIAEAISRVWHDGELRLRLIGQGRRRYSQARGNSLFSGWERCLTQS